MSKNLVICCDGTGNEINGAHSNVLKLYRVLRRSTTQTVYYDPGVGTLAAVNDWAKIRQNTAKVAGLAFGYGLDRNVLDAYEFLVRNYDKGDRIYMFGFSRGAYTVRVLAGFINVIGLVSQEQVHLCPHALVAYKRVTEQDTFERVRIYERVLRPTRPPIRFLGLWDTVSSLIVPRKDRLYWPTMQKLAYTAKNPSVEIVRHALAVDERRRMFRPFLWTEGEEYWGGPFPSKSPVPQDVKQVWFAGVHSDVGGGYPEKDSGLSKLALDWMIDEFPAELEVVTQSRNQIVKGKKRQNSELEYAAPSATAKIHDSMTTGWKPLEWIPKRAHADRWPNRRNVLGFYLPRSEPRPIEAGANIHDTVAERQKDVAGYDPVNLP